MDKGVSLVIMDRAEYNKKAEELLNTGTYKNIPDDPTRKQKNKLISILKNIKAEGGLNEDTYRRLYPTAAVASKFYGLPKIHKPGIPLRPIVSIVQDIKTSSGNVCPSCPQHQGLCTTNQRCQAKTGRVHHII